MTRAVLVLCMLGLTAALAGCHAPGDAGPHEGDDATDWRVGGAFTENTTQSDIDDLEARLEPFQAALNVMESFPMQYAIFGQGDDCAAVQEMLRGLDYIATVGECTTSDAGDDADAPTGG